MRTEQSYPISELVEYRRGGIDFAILRLAGNPGVPWGRTNISRTDAVVGEMLCIIGHPAGLPKRVEAGTALAPSGNTIRYNDIDTLGGNSGSGILRANDGRIVGVHTNGGCTASSPSGTDANSGMRIAAIIASSPTLQALTLEEFGQTISQHQNALEALEARYRELLNEYQQAGGNAG